MTAGKLRGRGRKRENRKANESARKKSLLSRSCTIDGLRQKRYAFEGKNGAENHSFLLRSHVLARAFVEATLRVKAGEDLSYLIHGVDFQRDDVKEEK